MFPSSAENSGKCYSQPLFGSFLSSESVETNGTDRYGAYESFKLGSLSTEVAERIYDNSYRGCSDTYLSTWSSDVMTDWDKPYLMSSQRSRSPFSDSSIEIQYSTSDSSSLYSPNHSRPAAIGSRGRDMQPYMQRNYCGRGAVVPEASGQGVGCSSQNPSICIDGYYTNSAALVFRGTKRKMMEPVPPCKLVKRKRMVSAACSISSSVGLNISKDGCICPDNKKTDGKHVDGKKVRAREKRRRRREKNHEKYGRKHRWAFTCALCKFHTFEDKDIENHLEAHIIERLLTIYDSKPDLMTRSSVFLHDCMVHKFHKTVSTLHKLKSSCGRSKDEWAKIMEEVTDDEYMRRMEVFYCVACDTHIPSVFTSVQQHLHSFTHLKSKEAYKEQLKRDSVITAKAIINNDNMKGEDPFAADAKDKSSDSQDQERSDEAEEDESENSDPYQWK